MSAGLMSLENLVSFLAAHEVEKIYVKELAANDNSKNQVYFGPWFKALTLFPMGEITPDPNAGNPIFKASVDYLWIGDDLSLVTSPSAQIILYPQYPEIRFSGFLKGADRTHLGSIRGLMNSRMPGRLLFLGVGRTGRIIGSAFDSGSPVAQQFAAVAGTLAKSTEIFYELLPSVFLGSAVDPRRKLLEELCRIHRLGWINSKRLDGNGNLLTCNAPQCGGYTLEAELGISPNGRSEPDFMGWEVKQHSGSVLTLMTPEPTGGFYVEEGVEQFVRSFGYPDRMGRPDRLNFGGTHYCDDKHPLTKLTIKLSGYDSVHNRIVDQGGGISLVADDGTVAAFWAFSGILSHWNRKHSKAVYVPSMHRTTPENQYCYDRNVLLGIGTDPLFLVRAFHQKKIYYDPGIKLEQASGPTPKTKRRNQFRVRVGDIGGLYDSLISEDVTGYC